MQILQINKVMKTLLSSVVSIGLLQTAFASENQNKSGGIPPGAPSGSYVNSCNLISYSSTEGILDAVCDYYNYYNHVSPKFEHHSTLDYRNICQVGSLVNNTNGNLTCESVNPSIPPGAYLNSCSNVFYNINTTKLTASCSYYLSNGDHSIQWKDTSLHFNSCSGTSATVNNINGSLSCSTN